MYDPLSDDDIEAYLGDRLPADRRDAIETYLAQHPAEAARVAHLRAHQEALRKIGDEIVNEPMPERFLEILYGTAPADDSDPQ